MSKLSGKWALITGASRGVGRQIALALAEQGCRLVLHGREASHCEGLARQLVKQGAEVKVLAAELSNGKAVDELIDRVLADLGGVDILYNNAAIMTPWREAHTTPVDDYRLSFEVNVIALTRLCDRLLPPMLTRRWGRIVNVTSGIENIRELLPYSMSKAAVDRYVRDVSPSLEGTGVIMSLLDPGWLRTDLGGDKAPNAVETCRPGVLVPLLLDDGSPSGKFYRAQDYRSDAAG
ncbi:MAG TPA: SDR family oxidoreductase [Polyangiaceae bacterium]|jgi:NAD(P)-dependent dehydrogenase (short-subunit alcohol dehydrogenase family)|nr:SDR family oxidoreductase [Polyangiaceae bacterium]